MEVREKDSSFYVLSLPEDTRKHPFRYNYLFYFAAKEHNAGKFEVVF